MIRYVVIGFVIAVILVLVVVVLGALSYDPRAALRAGAVLLLLQACAVVGEGCQIERKTVVSCEAGKGPVILLPTH
jgi:hypothetical protein